MILDAIYDVISDRRKNPVADSYVNYLQTKGVDKICKKIGEEASEVIIGAKNNSTSEVVYEMADLWFHGLVLLESMGVRPDAVYQELEKRFNK